MSDEKVKVPLPEQLINQQIAPLSKRIMDLREQLSRENASLNSLLLGFAYGACSPEVMEKVQRIVLTSDSKSIVLSGEKMDEIDNPL